MKLYEYQDVYWEYNTRGYNQWAVPFCPVHKIELNHNNFSGHCEKCKKTYNWKDNKERVADYLRREVQSEKYKDAEIISIDGIQTPQLKTRVKLSEENDDYWIEGRVNTSDKGKILVLYIGDKGPGKAQIFANIDQEKLSFDHKDRKPEDIISKLTIEFPSSKKMIMES